MSPVSLSIDVILKQILTGETAPLMRKASGLLMLSGVFL
jgi:hypothetical protein